MQIDINNPDRDWQAVYKLAITFVNPRPIALVSTVDADGRRNLAPFSFFNMVSANPPVMMICPARKRGGERKDTLVNISATGEFVVAVVTEAIAERMNQASAAYPPEVDEFDAAGFTPGESKIVAPALVTDSPVNCECQVDRIVDYGDQPGGGAVILGKIVCIHVEDSVLGADGLCDPAKLRTIGRMGRGTYARTSDRFDLPRAVIDQ